MQSLEAEMLRFLKVALVLTLWHSLCSDVEAQTDVAGVLKHARITETPGSNDLTFSWQTDERDLPFDHLRFDWLQALPDHTTWSLSGGLNTWSPSLLVDEGRNYSQVFDKSRLVPAYLGPLLFTITARTTSREEYKSEEILYTPHETFQTSSDIGLILDWPVGYDCSLFAFTVSPSELAGRLEYAIRQLFPEFWNVGKIENFSCFCITNSSLCNGTLSSASLSFHVHNSSSHNSRNATFYTAQLNQWLQRNDSHLVLQGIRFSVAMATCERYSTTRRQCLEHDAVTGSNASTSAFTGKSSANAQTGSGHVTGAIALVFFLVFMAAALVVLGIAVYLILSKRLILSWAGKPTASPVDTDHSEVEHHAAVDFKRQ